MSVNKVILLGRLGRDPEVKFMPNGDAVCNFSIATSDRWKDRNGEQQERTEWHNITAYRKQAEIIGQYFKKGNNIYIEGQIQSRKYTDKEGVERVAYEIKLSAFDFIDSKGSAPVEEATATPAAPPRRESAPAPVASQANLDDDIPF